MTRAKSANKRASRARETPSAPSQGQAERSLSDYFDNLNRHKPARLYDLVLSEIEEPLFVAVLDYVSGSQARAAAILGINRGTLRKKLREFGLSDSPHRRSRPTETPDQGLLFKSRRAARDARRELLSSNAFLGPAEFADMLGISRQALSKAIKAHRIFAVEQSGKNHYPAFFTDPHLDRLKLEQVSKALGDIGSWEKWQFFTKPRTSLGGITPLEALTRKDALPRVIAAARAFSER